MSKVFKAVGNAVTSVVKAVVNVVSTVVKAVVNVVADVINFVASPFMGMMGGIPDVPSSAAEAQRQDGVLLTRQGGGAVAIPVVYGYRRLGGVITFCETGSTNNKYLWVAYTFCEGPVEGINEIFIDDTQLSTDVVRGLNSGQVVDVPDAKYKGRVQLQFFPGVFFADPSQSSVGVISILKDAPSWKTSMAYNGLAVLMARYEWKTATTQAEADANPFSGGIPQIQVSMLGKKVASLRTNAGTENSSYQGSGYVERYSTNPAECLLDYLRNPRYGKGLVNTDIDWDSFYVAAQKCNQEISYTDSVKGPILTMNIVIDTNQTLFASIKNLLLNFRAYLPYVQGKYKLKIEDAGNATDIMSGAATISAVFNRDSILGEITYTGIDRSAKYNQVVVTYVDPDQKFSTQQVVYPPDEATRQVYIGYDGGRENKSEVTFSGITNQQIARDMARLIFNKSRYQETCSLSVSAEGFNLEPGDNIFIQSNILNFGSVPWRIVSLKLNNDYTFDLGCVRNPDFIYPYVIPNTPDTVVAPYIPKGATILPPLSGGQSLIGLVPPVTAPLLLPIAGIVVVPISTATNPPTTVTTGTNGGGVGGSTSTINTGGGTPPVAPPVVNVLKDVVLIDRVATTSAGTGLANVDITFNQPENAMYDGVQVYYKYFSTKQLVWSETYINTKPGAGKPITFRLSNLLSTSDSTSAYQIRMRVKYSTGEYSSKVAQFNAGTSTQEQGKSIDPADYSVDVVSGWSLPTTGSAIRNDVVGFITGLTATSGGNALTPRAMDITVQQDITNYAINSDITGIKVYYKPSTATYWDEQLLPFSNYVAGLKSTVRLSGLGVPGAPQFYDMIIRFAYRDGSESTYQIRYKSLYVEEFSGTKAFDPFYINGKTIEQVSAFAMVTTTMGILSGSVTDVRDTKIGVLAFSPGYVSTPTTAIVQIKPPTDATALASWVGVNFYYRKVVAGQNPAYTKLTFTDPPDGTFDSVVTKYLTVPFEYDVPYQVVIVPTVFYNGAVIESRFSFFGQGYIHYFQTRADWPGPGGNFIGGFNFQQIDTSIALGNLQTGFALPDPVAIVEKWTINTINNNGNVVNGVIPYYYEVVFDVSHITSFNEAIIWRRLNGGVRTGSAKYWQIGRWEKITLTTAFSGYSGGKFTVKLKLPISFYEFNSSATSTIATKLNATWSGSIKPISAPRGWEEFYIQIKAGGTIGSKAIRLPGYSPSGDVLDIKAKLPPLSPVVFADSVNDAQYDAGWDRKTTDARTATNAAIISAPNIAFNTFGTYFPPPAPDFISGAV
jgi:hypothetical protein